MDDPRSLISKKGEFYLGKFVKDELGARCYCCECQEAEEETKGEEEVSLLIRP